MDLPYIIYKIDIRRTFRSIEYSKTIAFQVLTSAAGLKRSEAVTLGQFQSSDASLESQLGGGGVELSEMQGIQTYCGSLT